MFFYLLSLGTILLKKIIIFKFLIFIINVQYAQENMVIDFDNIPLNLDINSQLDLFKKFDNIVPIESRLPLSDGLLLIYNNYDSYLNEIFDVLDKEIFKNFSIDELIALLFILRQMKVSIIDTGLYIHMLDLKFNILEMGFLDKLVKLIFMNKDNLIYISSKIESKSPDLLLSLTKACYLRFIRLLVSNDFSNNKEIEHSYFSVRELLDFGYDLNSLITNNHLNLKNSFINSLDGLLNIPGIETVEYINLANNKITDVTNAFEGLDNLKYIDLSGNALNKSSIDFVENFNKSNR